MTYIVGGGGIMLFASLWHMRTKIDMWLYLTENYVVNSLFQNNNNDGKLY